MDYSGLSKLATDLLIRPSEVMSLVRKPTPGRKH